MAGRIFPAVFPLLLTVAFATPTFAQQSLTAQDILDSECAIVFAGELGALDENADPAVKTGLTAIVGYYIGKLNGRTPGFDFNTAWSVEFASQLESRKADIRARCAVEVMKMGQDMIVVSQQLINAGGG